MKSKARRGRRVRFLSIYEIKSLHSGKVYIGSSKDTLLRWNSHIYDLVTFKHCSKELLKEYKSLGVSNFTFRILLLIPIDKATNIRKIEQDFLNNYKKEVLFNTRRATN
jgi:hypothetical protein